MTTHTKIDIHLSLTLIPTSVKNNHSPALARAVSDRVRLVTGTDVRVDVGYVTSGEHTIEPDDIDSTYHGLSDHIRGKVIPVAVFDVERNALPVGDVFDQVIESARREIPALERKVATLASLIDPAVARVATMYRDLEKASKLSVELVSLFARHWRDWYVSDVGGRGTWSSSWWRIVSDPDDGEEYVEVFATQPWREYPEHFNATEITQLDVVFARVIELADAIDVTCELVSSWRGDHAKHAQRLAGLRDLVQTTQPVDETEDDMNARAIASMGIDGADVEKLAGEIKRVHGDTITVASYNGGGVLDEHGHQVD